MSKKAFTLAEALITLGIIGFVLAVTLPILTKNYNNKVMAEKLKKADTPAPSDNISNQNVRNTSKEAQRLRESRALAQNGQVNSPRPAKGHVTVYDAKSGTSVSATPEAAKVIEERNAKLKADAPTGATGETPKPAETPKAAETPKPKKASKLGKFFGKIGKFFKGKGGKIGLIVAGVAALAAGAIALFGKKKGSEAVAADEAQEQQPVVTPTTPEETTPEETTPTVPVIPETPESSLQGIYTVVKGDCVWNIAKARLKEINGTDPTDAEIQKEVYRIMDKNKDASSENGTIKLEWEPDHYHVMIRPGDKIDLSA